MNALAFLKVVYLKSSLFPKISAWDIKTHVLFIEIIEDKVKTDADIPFYKTKITLPFQLAYINKTHPRPCDKEVELYKLQNHKLQTDGAYKPVKGKLSNCHPNGCGR